MPRGPEHGLTWNPGEAAEEVIPELDLKGWNEKDHESQRGLKACEGKAVCKKGWHVPTVSGLGGQSGEESGGTSEAVEEAGAGAEALLCQATGAG